MSSDQNADFRKESNSLFQAKFVVVCDVVNKKKKKKQTKKHGFTTKQGKITFECRHLIWQNGGGEYRYFSSVSDKLLFFNEFLVLSHPICVHLSSMNSLEFKFQFDRLNTTSRMRKQ